MTNLLVHKRNQCRLSRICSKLTEEVLLLKSYDESSSINFRRFAMTLETVGATNSLVFVVKEKCIKPTKEVEGGTL